MCNTSTDVIGAWKSRIERAQQSAVGLTMEFHTTYQGRDEETMPYHDHEGQQVAIAALLIEPGVKHGDDWFDEEALPYFVGRFADGVKLVCGFEEVFTHNERLLELASAVNAGFNISRRMDYISPHDLAENGTDEEKMQFATEVQTLNFGNAQNFNTPPEYRE